jgi:hypothetical protein
MRVPTETRDVPITATTLQPAREPRITTPTISRERVVPAAFGGPEARAMEDLGRVGEQIANHLQQMAIDAQDKEVLNRETSYRQNIQDRLNNVEEETVKIDGQEITRPKGFLRRQLNLAKGATEELDKIYQDEIREQSLSGLSQYQLDKLSPAMDSYYLSVRNKVITHEANQLDEDFKNTIESNLKQKTLDASIIRDDEQLNIAIDDAINTAAPYNRKFDEATRKILNEEIAGDIAEASTMSTLQNTGDLVLSQLLLDSTKDKMAQSTYDDIKSKLSSGYRSMKTEAERIRKEERIATRVNLIEKTANNELDWTNSAEIIRQVARTDKRLADAMTKAIRETEIDIEDDDESFLELSENMFTSTDPEEISDFLVDALSDTKDISKDRLAILVYAAKKRAEEIERGDKKGFLETVIDIINSIPFTSPTSPANVLVNTLMRVQGENAQDTRVLEITNEEIERQTMLDNPNRSSYKIGQTINTPSGFWKVVDFDKDGEPIVERE